jgi:hypothetical protein
MEEIGHPEEEIGHPEEEIGHPEEEIGQPCNIINRLINRLSTSLYNDYPQPIRRRKSANCAHSLLRGKLFGPCGGENLPAAPTACCWRSYSALAEEKKICAEEEIG